MQNEYLIRQDFWYGKYHNSASKNIEQIWIILHMDAIHWHHNKEHKRKAYCVTSDCFMSVRHFKQWVKKFPSYFVSTEMKKELCGTWVQKREIPPPCYLVTASHKKKDKQIDELSIYLIYPVYPWLFLYCTSEIQRGNQIIL
jgi:hypothetical protein